MRTKTLLLSVAALLAAGIVSSQAQPVYSQNIVGYASVPTPNGGTYLITVPFVIGVSNGANEIWPVGGGLPDFSELSIWNGAGYNNYLSDHTSPSGWDDAVSFNPVPAPTLPVGKGFFLIPSASTTNTFAGTVAVNVGTSNKTSLANGGTYLVGSAVPYAGAVTNGNPATGVGGLNLTLAGGLPDFSELSIWNGNGYNNYLSDHSSPSGWDDAVSFNPVPVPTVSVGQGFFIIPSGNFIWTVGL
jgi:hypothetical protein